MQASEVLDESKAEGKVIETEMAECNAEIEECNAAVETSEKVVAEIEAEKEAASNSGLKEMEAAANELSKVICLSRCCLVCALVGLLTLASLC